MSPYLDVTHVALHVASDLRSAEEFYCRLFDLAVSWREPVPPDAPFDLSWEDHARAGSQPEIAMLHSGALRMSITGDGTEVTARAPIEHVGIQVTVEQLRAVRERSIAGGFRVVTDREDELFDFVDLHGVEWELDTRSFADPLSIVEAKRRREGA
jgi:hypothetical protein